MPVNFITSNPTSDAFDARTKNTEDTRAVRLKNDEAVRANDTSLAVDAAIRESAGEQPTAAPAVAPPSMLQGSSATQPMGANPTITTQDLAAGSPAVTTPMSAAVAATPTAPSPGLMAGPTTTFAGQNQAAIAAAQQVKATGKLSPFDSPQFSANLQARLANIPGAGAQLLQMKKERDEQISKVLEMSAAGHTDTARYLAQQHGIELPEQLFQDGDMAGALDLAKKAYPDESDKGQAFFKTYMSTPGALTDKVNAGMAVAGVPTPADTRKLNNALALLKFKADHPGLSGHAGQRYYNVANVGLVDTAANGGPQIVIGPRGFDYQTTLQKNMKIVAEKSPYGTPSNKIYEDAVSLTDRMSKAGGNAAPANRYATPAAAQPAQAQPYTPPAADPSTPVAPTGMVTPPVSTTAGGAVDPNVAGMFPAAPAAPVQPTLPPPAAAAQQKQLPSRVAQGTVIVKNRAGRTLQIPQSDLVKARAKGFEVVSK